MPRRHKPTEQRAIARHFYEHQTQNAAEAARLTGISERTMQRYFAKLRRGQSLDDKPRSGRPRKVDTSLRNRLRAIKSQYPQESARFYAQQLSEGPDMRVSERTVQRAFHQMGFTYRLPRRGGLTSAHKQARLSFARKHRNESWGNKWSFDEAYFNLWKATRKVWVSREEEEETNLPYLTNSQEKISIGMAVAIAPGRKSALAFLPKNWEANKLIQLWNETLLPSLTWKRGPRNYNELMLDNDGRHQQRIWHEYMKEKVLRPIKPWPAHSPDLNPVENVFAWMKRFVQKQMPTTELALRQAIIDAWDAVPLEMTTKVFDDMPRRVLQVIRLEGKMTGH